jgi:hypothetical protein
VAYELRRDDSLERSAEFKTAGALIRLASCS